MEKFIQLGEKFGLEGEKLLEFVRRQLEEEKEEKRRQLEKEGRTKRRLERELRKLEMEAELVLSLGGLSSLLLSHEFRLHF